MKQDIKDKWIEAMQSGKYTKTKYRMKRDDSFCALGILCDISHLSYWKTLDTTQVESYMGSSHELPETVRKWANISRGAALVVSSISDLNDSFAEVIEYVKGLPND